MDCPVCKSATLWQKELETGLQGRECNRCGGWWIPSHHYWKWNQHSGRHLPAQVDTVRPDVQAYDTKTAKLCPECGHLLRRYPVGKGLPFSLDRCGNCGGIWFDKNEWKLLKSRGLHEDVHKIFSEIWQHQLRSQAHQDAMEKIYEDKFGVDDYARIKAIKEWIQDHPHSAELKAFLNL